MTENPWVRWSLSTILIVLVWCDVKWALYLTITLLAVAVELLAILGQRLVRRERVNQIFERILR